jgi:hypothetical protein
MENILGIVLSVLTLVPGLGLIQILPVGITLGLPPTVIILASSIIGTVKEVSAPRVSGSSEVLSTRGIDDRNYIKQVITAKVAACIAGVTIGLIAGSVTGVGESLKLNPSYTIAIIVMIIAGLKDRRENALVYLAGVILLFTILKNNINSIGIVILTISVFTRSPVEAPRVNKVEAKANPNPILSILSVVTTLFLPGISASALIYSWCENELVANVTAISAGMLAEGIGVGLANTLTFSGKTLIGSYATEPISLLLVGVVVIISSAISYSAAGLGKAYISKSGQSIGRIIMLCSLIYMVHSPALLLAVSIIGYGISKIEISNTAKGLTFVGLTL